jgi:hypothetical protein
MVSRTAIVAIIITVVLAVGGIYLIQKSTTPTLSPMPTAKPDSSPTPAAKSTVTETPTTTATPTQTPTPIPVTIEEARVRQTMMDFIDAYNRHSIEDAVSFFTEGAERTVSQGGETFKATGGYQITRQFDNFFRNYPDIAITVVVITKLNVTGDKATVQIKYISTSPKNQLSVPYIEDMELAKVGDMWKITQDVANQVRALPM